MATALNFMARRDAQKLEDRCVSVFNMHEQLPEQVFRRPFDYYYVAEDDWLMTSEFYRYLRASNLCRSEIITVASLNWNEPKSDPGKQAHSVMDAIALPQNIEPDEYAAAFDIGEHRNPTPALRHQSISIWLPDTVNWAAWRDWNSELCILASSSSIEIDNSLVAGELFTMRDFVYEVSYLYGGGITTERDGVEAVDEMRAQRERLLENYG